MPKGWKTKQFKRTEELDEYSWTQGYYHATHENWDGITWTRNFHELCLRDLAIFAMGDIKGKKILDLGCGDGLYMLILAQMGAEVCGQDVSSKNIEGANSILKKNGFNCETKVGSASKLMFLDNSFDMAFSGDFFEHITLVEKKDVVSEVFRVLKPGGSFTIKTPNLQYQKMVLWLKRVSAIIKNCSSFNIHIPHTQNNPDNEHHGLTTYKELENLLTENMFHTPAITFCPLIRKGLPEFISKILYGNKLFSEHIIITTKKSIFYSLYP